MIAAMKSVKPCAGSVLLITYSNPLLLLQPTAPSLTLHYTSKHMSSLDSQMACFPNAGCFSVNLNLFLRAVSLCAY